MKKILTKLFIGLYLLSIVNINTNTNTIDIIGKNIKNEKIKINIQELQDLDNFVNKSYKIYEKNKIIKKKQQQEKYIFIYFPEDLVDLSDERNIDCSNTIKLLQGKNKFIIYDNNISKQQANKCFDIWGLNIDKWRNENKNIFFLDKNNKNILEKKLKIKILTNKKIRDYMYLYNLYKGKIFHFTLDKTLLFEVSKVNLHQFIKWSRKYNNNFEKKIKKINNFLKQNNIKQNIYKGWKQIFLKKVYQDGVKCNTYTLTLYKIILENININLKEYNKTFENIDKVRIKNNLKGKYLGWTNSDIVKYLKFNFYDITNKYYLYNFISVKISKKYWHSGLKMCGLYRCYIYFPDEGQFIEENKYKKIGKYRYKKIENDVSFIYFKENNLTKNK